MNKVFIVDDHPMICQGVSTFLSQQPDFDVLFTANSISETLEKISGVLHHDSVILAVIDIRIGADDGFQLLKELTALGIRCIMYSMFKTPSYILKSVEGGAFGYVLKNTRDVDLLVALRKAAAGEKYLTFDLMEDACSYMNTLASFTKKERVIFESVLENKSSHQIAQEQHISLRTVENYLSIIYDKTGLSTKDEIRKVYGVQL